MQVGIFEQFIENPTCRHILFGACHDNGYVRLLEKYAADSAVTERVTLLYSFETGREFTGLPFKSTKMDAVFRTQPLNGSASRAVTTVYSGPQNGNLHADNLTWAARAEVARGATKVTGPPKITNVPAGTVLVNAANKRVDALLSTPPPAAVESWRHKTKVAGMKYCRTYQLQGNCKGNCSYSHGPLSEGEKLVYRISLRREQCHVGVQCRDPGCFYGHNCWCKQRQCSFPAQMHDIDASTAKIWKGL